jgi:DNA polymerase III epsilon subunit-like protein
VLDLETTGLRPGSEPVEVAVVGPRGDVLVDTLVRPGCKVEAGAARIHGLDEDALAAAPGFAEVYPVLQGALRGRVVVAFVAACDRAILEHACRTKRLPPLAGRWDCAHARYADWRGFSASLSIACEIEGIAIATHHRAAPDARRVWELIQRMAAHAH